MTENKQITIYDLLPLLKPGWVAMQKNGEWTWWESKPHRGDYIWCSLGYALSHLFNIAPFDGNWKDSLIEVK